MRFTVSSRALSAKLVALARVINTNSVLGDIPRDVTAKVTKTIQREERLSNNRVTTPSETPQSQYPHAARGNSQPDRMPDANRTCYPSGDNAQKGRCRTRHAVVRAGRPCEGKGGVRADEAFLLGQSRLARHRRGCHGVLQGAEVGGGASRRRTTASDREGYDGRAEKGLEPRAAEFPDRGDSTGTLSLNDIDNWRA